MGLPLCPPYKDVVALLEGGGAVLKFHDHEVGVADHHEVGGVGAVVPPTLPYVAGTRYVGAGARVGKTVAGLGACVEGNPHAGVGEVGVAGGWG